MATRWMLAAMACAVLGLFTIGTANAEPTQPPAPEPAATSTSDELADMVMDVIERGGGGTAPTTTPVPAPPG